MSQSHRHSVIESVVATGVGLAYAIPINYLFIRYVRMEPWIQAVVLTGLLTVLSFAVKYVLRRIFNRLTEQGPG